jgi:hypothetical protein
MKIKVVKYKNGFCGLWVPEFSPKLSDTHLPAVFMRICLKFKSKNLAEIKFHKIDPWSSFYKSVMIKNSQITKTQRFYHILFAQHVSTLGTLRVLL